MASFLATVDKHTRGMCLVDIKNVDDIIASPVPDRSPRACIPSRPRWARVVSKRRAALSLGLLATCILVVGILYNQSGPGNIGSKGYDTSLRGLWRIGFGQVDPELLITYSNIGTPLTLSLLANLPQLVLAAVYYLYNGLLTAFITAHEYASFGSAARHIRVSSPAGKQLGTWFLGMPWGWGVCFLVTQILLHWFVSQAFFVVDVSVFDVDGSPLDRSYSIFNLGFSPLGMLCSIVMGVLMLLFAVLRGLRRFPVGSPPSAGNSSAAIAAACHPGVYEEKTAFMDLKWGSHSFGPDRTDHCSFIVASDEDGAAVLINPPRESVYYK